MTSGDPNPIYPSPASQFFYGTLPLFIPQSAILTDSIVLIHSIKNLIYIAIVVYSLMYYLEEVGTGLISSWDVDLQ